MIKRRVAAVSAFVLTLSVVCGGVIGAGAVHTRRLPEVIVHSRPKDANVMYIAGIVREYSYLQTHFDTVL